MPENTIYVVEALIKGNWESIMSTMDEDRAKEVKDDWLAKGMAPDEIRITKSEIKFNKPYKDD